MLSSFSSFLFSSFIFFSSSSFSSFLFSSSSSSFSISHSTPIYPLTPTSLTLPHQGLEAGIVSKEREAMLLRREEGIQAGMASLASISLPRTVGVDRAQTPRQSHLLTPIYPLQHPSNTPTNTHLPHPPTPSNTPSTTRQRPIDQSIDQSGVVYLRRRVSDATERRQIQERRGGPFHARRGTFRDHHHHQGHRKREG